MAKTAQQILGQPYLTELVQEIKTGIPDLLPGEFNTIKDQVFGDAARHIRVQGVRQVARQSIYGSPPRRRTPVGLSEQDVKLLHFNEAVELKVQDFMNLREYDRYVVQQLGIQEISRMAANARQLFDNARIAAKMSMLAYGAIYFDVDGNITTSASTGITMDYGVSAAHKNQLNGIIGASWATAGTDIPTDILQIKDQALIDTGYSLEGGYAFYGRNIPSYFAGNTLMLQYLARHPQFRERFMDTLEIPDGLFGLKWRRVSGGFFNDQNDASTAFFGVDAVTFTPPVDRSWYTFLEGSYPVPTTFGPMPSLEAAAESFDWRYGIGSYAVPMQKVPSAELIFFDTQLPWLKVPDSIFIADVTP